MNSSRPAIVQFLDVDLVVDAGEFHEVEQEERRICIGEGGVVGHRACAADTRIEFAEIDLVVLDIDQEIEVEIAAIAFLAQLVAEAIGHVARLGADLFREGARKISLPHQPPL